MRNTEHIIDSLSTIVEQRLNYIGTELSNIADNTNSFAGFTNSSLTILSVAASIITIIIFLQIKEFRLSRDTQKMIMLDLMRHFMVNNAILETILAKLGSQKPIEGTLSRFASLDNDLELGKFMLEAKHYETLHNVCLKIRNYNSVASYADKHMYDDTYPSDILINELQSLHSRSQEITKLLYELSTKIHKGRALTSDDFAKYVTAKYNTKLGISNKKFEFSSYSSSDLGLTYEHIVEDQSNRIIFLNN